ncbi:MAG: response regulator, partial [Ruthenibacterium sp.]
MFSLDEKIGIVIAEDEKLIRQSIIAKIKAADADFEVLAEAENGLAALEAVKKYNPQVVITDIKMPEMDGIALARALSLGFPTIKVVILSGYSDFSFMQQSIRYGVINYLLKPVENEALAEMLYDLKSSIISYRHTQNRTVIYSSNYKGSRDENCHYAVFSVCVGNLCYDVEDDLLEKLYEQQQMQIDWHTLLNALYPDAIDWYLADEEEKNQKMICYSVPPDKPADYAALAQALQAGLAQRVPGVPIHVCTARGSLAYADVWMCAQRMRNILKQKIVPAKSSCFLLEEDETSQSGDNPGILNLGILKMHIADHLRTALEQKDTAAVRAELQLIFKYMSDNHLPQQDW